MPPAPPRSDVRKDSRPRAADRIRATANELFYRNGIRAVGVDEIVSRAGVTKPSLYRAFPSKDELAAAYLREFETGFWARFEEGKDEFPDDPRAQLMVYLRGLAERSTRADARGCGLTNAVIEYPEQQHPARLVAENNKRDLRTRLHAMAAQMGAANPSELGDGLMLLIEGAFVTGQIFGTGSPAAVVAEMADRLIDASLPRRG